MNKNIKRSLSGALSVAILAGTLAMNVSTAEAYELKRPERVRPTKETMWQPEHVAGTFSTGGSGTYALTGNGTVMVTGTRSSPRGYNYVGKDGFVNQVGSGGKGFLEDVVQISDSTQNNGATMANVLALKENGSVWAWGENGIGTQIGILGIGSITKSVEPFPVRLSNLSDIVKISNSGDIKLALKSDGTVYFWGYNYNGKAATGVNDDIIISPIRIPNLSEVVEISAGGGFALALKSDGTVWGWGRNNYGQLGQNNLTRYDDLIQITELEDIISISAGENYSLALKSDGTIYSWGRNDYGQLGNSSKDYNSTPTKVEELKDITSIYTGGTNSGAIRSDGSYFWWGGYSQINGYKISYPELTANNVVAVSQDNTRAVMLKSDGTMWGFGYNYYSALGSESPTLVDNLDPIQMFFEGQKEFVNKDVEEATAAVVKAEGSKKQEDVDSARDLVNALPESEEKTDLNNRLDAVQAEIDEINEALVEAIAAVVKAENSLLELDYTTANDLVTELTESDEKTALQDRLAIVKNKIDDAKKIVEATAAVVKAEGSKTQEDVDSARDLVNALSESQDKNDLNDRLDIIQAEIDAINEALVEATAAVVKVENSLLESDYTTANDLVTALTASAEKTALQNRLTIVKNKIDDAKKLVEATAAVIKAEDSLLELDYTTANGLVTALPSSVEKNTLQGRLAVVRTKIDNAKKLVEATAAVVKVEGSLLELDYTTANGLVTALPSSVEKNTLQDRLAIVRTKIDNAEALVQATAAVVKAEGSKTQDDIDSARVLVIALTESSEKQDLSDRLDDIQTEIDDSAIIEEELKEQEKQDRKLQEATAAVVKAEGSKEQVDVDSARILVEDLPLGEDRTNLEDRLNAIEQYIEDKAQEEIDKLNAAIIAVEVAESTVNQNDVDYAKSLVNTLPNSNTKSDLTERLNVVQEIINYNKQLADATTAVVKAENTHNKYDIINAYNKVNRLKESQEKTNLLNRLNELEEQIEEQIIKDRTEQEAIRAVEIAEKIKTPASIEDAKNKVKKVKDDVLREELEERLMNIELEIEEIEQAQNTKAAERLVNFAEIFKRDPHLSKAQAAVDELRASEEKLALQVRLDKITGAGSSGGIITPEMKAQMIAEQAVERAEEFGYAVLIRAAVKIVDELPESENKNELTIRIENLL